MGAYTCDRKFVLDYLMQESFSKIKLKSILSKILAIKYITNKTELQNQYKLHRKVLLLCFFFIFHYYFYILSLYFL